MNVLYVSRDKQHHDLMCPGSIVCLSIAEKINDAVLSIQDCDILKQKSIIPSWLDGTPILINENEGIPYRGKDAINKLNELMSQQPKETENRGKAAPDIDDHFKLDVQPIDEEKNNGKITEADLQKFMEIRNQSVASQSQQIQQPQT